MRPVLIAFTLLAATTATVSAQTDKSQEDRTRAEMRLQQELYGCPVGITAQHQGSPAAIWTTSLEDSHKSPTELAKMHSGVHVDLAARTKAIKSVDLAVFYLSPGSRVLPVTGSQFAPSSVAPSETSKNFSLFAGSASRRLDGDLLLGPVASVTRVSLMHVTYSDSSEWNAHSSATCSIKPSLYMPVQTK